MSDFKFNDEEKFNQISIDPPVREAVPHHAPNIDRKTIEKEVMGLLQDWEDRKNGTKKATSVPLITRCFALEFQMESLNRFRMRVSFIN